MQREESQNRRNDSNLNPRFKPLCGATPIYIPSFSYITGTSSNPMFSVISHNQHPEISLVMFEGINNTSASLGS